MTTFDGWEALVRPPEDYLMHFRTKGSKNGVRRYQTESGEWTPLGLAERKKREGWGDKRSLKRAERQVRKHSRAIAKLDRKHEKDQQKAERKAARAEQRRLGTIKGLTDEELRAKIERVKMENEYKELTKSGFVKAGEKFIEGYMKNKAEKAERAYERERQKHSDQREDLARKHELTKMDKLTEQKKLDTEAAKNRADADKARAEADKKRAETDEVDIKSGTRMKKLKNEQKSLRLQNKRFKSENTILGGVRAKINKIQRGQGDAAAESYRGYSEYRNAIRLGKADAKIAKKLGKTRKKYGTTISGGSKNYFEEYRKNKSRYGNVSNNNNNGNNNENPGKKKKKKGGG